MKNVIVICFFVDTASNPLREIYLLSLTIQLAELNWYGCSIAANYPDFWIAVCGSI
jgi:hypothetical protein